MELEAIAIRGIPIVREGDDLVKIISTALRNKEIELKDGDIIVITEKIVSKAEGRIVELEEVRPSGRAEELAKATGKDPRIVELILRESKDLLGIGENFIIVETKQGFVCANAGIDQSNIEEGKAKLLPEDPDKSAERIRKGLEEMSGRRLGVVIADSWGRPFRCGSIGVAIGASGIRALWDRRGEKDIYGRELQVTRVAVGDCLASMASLLLGEARERVPCVVIRGLDFMGEGKAGELLREKEKDIFR
jgi:coenzyme F420-0:L-glutamate ligase/coenzyme F420-1:gamma-L-glutamate ligase